MTIRNPHDRAVLPQRELGALRSEEAAEASFDEIGQVLGDRAAHPDHE